MTWGYSGYGATATGNSTNLLEPTIIADYSKHNYEEEITTSSTGEITLFSEDGEDVSLRKVTAVLTTKSEETPTVLGILNTEETIDGVDGIYEIELPLGALTATPVVFANDSNAKVQFYNVDMDALDGSVFVEAEDENYAGASLNTYDVASSDDQKVTKYVKVHVESATGNSSADYMIKIINYPSETITASPVSVTMSTVSGVVMTDGRVYTSGRANTYALGRGTSVPFGTVDAVNAGDSGASGTYLGDVIYAGTTNGNTESMYAIKKNGSVWAWGYNGGTYQLGNGSTTNSAEPVRVGASYLTMSQYLYSLKQVNADGPTVQLTTPTIDSFNVFDSNTGEASTADLLWQTYDGNSDVVEIVDAKNGIIRPVGVGTTYVIVSIANDPLTTGLVKIEVRPETLEGGAESVAYPQVAAGTDFSIALKADGTVWTWGNNSYGQLGNGMYNGTVVYPKKIESLTNIVKIAAAGQFAMALRKDGTVWTWGRNNVGELGIGTTENSNVPVQVVKGAQNADDDTKVYLEDIVAIAAGGLQDDNTFAMAVSSDGVVYGFGSNWYNPITTANVGYYTVPTATPAKNIVDIKAGKGATTYALTSNGLVYAFGKNYAYEYGTGRTSGSVLTLVPLENRVMAIGAGNQNGIAVTYSLDNSSKPQTETYAWGNNAYQAISSTNDAQIRTPKTQINQVMLGRDNTALVGGGDSIYTIDSDGNLKMSGLGTSGQLASGSNTSTTQNEPYSDFTKDDDTTANDAIAAASSIGGSHSLYIDASGYVWSVGDNTSSQLAQQNAGDNINKAQKIGSQPTITVSEREILAKKDKTTDSIGSLIDIADTFNVFSSADAAATYSQEYDVWDDTVAEIDSDGRITGKGVGQTYAVVKIKDTAGTVINTQYILVSVVPDKDEYITYRWWRQDRRIL
jgi:alpha-tubulin suppressor-like RCC1 family protein